MESDQDVKSITGVCPLCDKESEQFLRWIIKDVNNPEEDGGETDGDVVTSKPSEEV